MLSEYTINACTALRECGAKMKIEFCAYDFPPWKDDGSTMTNHYKVKITGPGGSYTLDFWDSIYNTENGEQPNEYDVIACLEWYTADSFEDFCDEFGYDTDSRKAEKTYKACRKQTENLRRIFPNEKHREILAEIR